MQFPEWYKKLESMQKEVLKFDVDSKVEVVMRRAIFELVLSASLFLSTG